MCTAVENPCKTEMPEANHESYSMIKPSSPSHSDTMVLFYVAARFVTRVFASRFRGPTVQPFSLLASENLRAVYWQAVQVRILVLTILLQV